VEGLPFFIMLPRTRLSFLAVAALLVLAASRLSATDAGPEPTGESPDAEAQRLYDRADDYVASIKEGDYSYSYIQFYWKRAQSNIDRILRVYPQTPVGRQLKAGMLEVGPYELDYFKSRVLFRLEEKRLAADDSVNCAIFLCEAKGNLWDEARRMGVARIIEALSRQKRWGEALKFPVLPADRMLKWTTVFRVAARFEQADLVKEMLANTARADLPEVHAIYGEALALRGRPRKEISALLDRDPADAVKLAVLSGMVQRESKIQLAATLRLPVSSIFFAGDSLKRPEVRDDVSAVARAFFPRGNPAAEELLATYHAALGERPAPGAAGAVHVAYLQYLAAFEKFDELGAYLLAPELNGRATCELTVMELLAQANRTQDSERYRAPYIAAGGETAETAALAQFRGQMNSTEAPFTVHEKTLAALPFKDPAVLAQAMMEWSLSPNRSIRGASPYDAVVRKFSPGFDNIPAPKSIAVRDAASVQKPY